MGKTSRRLHDSRAAAEDSAHAGPAGRLSASAGRFRCRSSIRREGRGVQPSGSGMAGVLKQVAVFSASQLDQVTIFGLGIMPYISASIIFQLLGSVWQPLERLQKEGETGRKKINEYTRYATVVHVPGPKLGLRRAFVRAATGSCDAAVREPDDAGSSTFGWHDRRRADDDRRHDVPDVARRADRRVRHRQRHQPADHGGHSGRHARRRHAACCEQSSLELARRRRRAGHRAAARSWPCCSWPSSSAWCSSRSASGAFPRKAPSTFAAAACMGGTRQYLPLQGESGGRDADHLRQQLADAAGAAVRQPGRARSTPTDSGADVLEHAAMCSARTSLRLQPAATSR